MLKIIDRYILKEIGFPFLMTLFIFTFVLLIGKILQIMEMMVNKGISFFSVAQLILFIMPSFLTFTIPISFLIAILVGLGRLSGDNEITVLRASGISLYQLMKPIGIAAVLVCLFAAAIGQFAPFSNQASKSLLFQIVKQKASIGIKEKVFNDDFQGLVLYADHIPSHGDYMEGVLISDSRMLNEPATIIASKGHLISNPRSMTVTLRLTNGSVHAVDSDLQKYKTTAFSSYDVNLDLKKTMAGGADTLKKSSIDMTMGELLKNTKRKDLPPEEVRDMIIEFHKKMTIPLSCLVFALLAVPFGIVNKRSGKSRGFTIGLLIVVIYYTLQLGGEALGETGKVPAALAVWIPNIVLGTAGLYLFRLAAKEETSRFLAVTDAVVYRAKGFSNEMAGRVRSRMERFKRKA